MNSKFTRRFLLRAGSTAALTLPFLRSRQAFGQTAPRKRLLIFATPNGTVMSEFWPGTSSTYKAILSPLQSLQSKTLVLRGLDNKGAVAGASLPGHVPDFPSLLTGRAAGAGSNYGAALLEGPSIDQHIAAAIGDATRLRSKELGIGGYSGGYALLAKAARQPITPDISPYNAFTHMFANVVVGGGTTTSTGPDPAVVRLHAARKSIFDATRGELASLRCLMGSGDRVAFDAHIESIREIERELTFDETETDPEPTAPANICYKPTLGAQMDVKSMANYAKLVKLQIDIAAAAFACDVTRVITLQFHHGASGVHHSWANSQIAGKSHHGIGHNSEGVSASSTDRINWLIAIEKWFATQFAYLASQLNALDDGDGKTVLDNTALVWAHEQSDGGSHKRTDMPFVITGGLGGYFKTGQNLDLGGKAVNDLLITLAEGMGVPTKTFGTASYCTGVLPGLLA